MIADQTPAMRSSCWLLSLTLMLPCQALAWNSPGHRLVACIAWDFLAERSRIEISHLLRAHPDYERWLKRAGNDSTERGAFIEASTWPDDIRNDRRFYSAGTDEATPLLPGFPTMERHRDWHYLNRPLDDTPRNQVHSKSVSGLLDKQLVALVKTLGSPDGSTSERSYALPWLIHLVGDAHQPLHSSIRIDEKDQLDRQGNGLRVINPFNPRKNSSTLHAFWDDLPGPAGLRGERLDRACRELSAVYSRPAYSTSAQWLDESWQIARDSAYPPGDDTVPTIREAFYERAKEIADRRITQAGYRLADLLNYLFGTNKLRD